MVSDEYSITEAPTNLLEENETWHETEYEKGLTLQKFRT
jgi:hypothetical protein